jgi:DNA-binding LytR/AlgR family response regulator
MMMKCIAIDDEHLALSKILRYSEKIDYLQVGATFTNAIEALAYIKKHPVDLIFLDIQMDEFSGIDLLEAANDLPYVIITSAFNTYAIKSFEYNVIDYLLKPIQFPRFVKAVEKVYQFYRKDLRLKEKKQQKAVMTPQSLLVKSGREVVRIPVPEILYIEGVKDYLAIVLEHKKVLTLMGFDAILKELPADHFCRVHRSYIVQLGKIEKAGNRSVEINERTIPVSNSYRSFFKEKLSHFRVHVKSL